MDQSMRFGLVLGRLAILKKKIWADYEQLLRVLFSCFHVQKSKIFFENIVVSALKSCILSRLSNSFLAENRLNLFTIKADFSLSKHVKYWHF
jgi:hypothetical protein